jgi:hypothetical protein
LAAVLSACSGGSDATSRSASTSTTSTTSPSQSTSSTSTTRQPRAAVIFGNATAYESAVGVASRMGGPTLFVTIQCTRLCVTLGDADFGCDDAGPVIGPGQDQTTARFTAEVQGSLLAYGHLPESATAVVGVFNDGRRLDDDVVSKPVPSVVSNAAPRVWALPLPGGVQVSGAPSIFYVAADGTETPAPKAY